MQQEYTAARPWRASDCEKRGQGGVAPLFGCAEFTPQDT